jgi:hypothetical protein
MALPTEPKGGRHVFRHLTDDGLVGDGSNQVANRNGAVTAVPFYAGPAAGKVWDIYRMLVTIEDNAVFTAANYGGVSTLTNGVTLQICRNGAEGLPEVLDLMDGGAATGLVSWADFCYDMTTHTFGSGNNFAVARWTFAKAGEPLRLVGANGDVLQALIQDDLTGLVGHQFFIQGIEY